MIKYTCSNCGQKFKSADEYAGKMGKCHNCGSVVPIPEIANREVFSYCENDISDDDVAQNPHQEEPEFINNSSLKGSGWVKAIFSNVKPAAKSSYKEGSLAKGSNWQSPFLVRNKVIAFFALLLISIVVIVPIIQGHKRQKEAHNSIDEMLRDSREADSYRRQGKEYPGTYFRNNISEMRELLVEVKPVEIELKSIVRNVELGVTYLEYKASALRLGTVIDRLQIQQNCIEAKKLTWKFEEVLYNHEQACHDWNRYIEYDTYKYSMSRDVYIEKALESTQEFFDYCDFIRDECEKRGTK